MAMRSQIFRTTPRRPFHRPHARTHSRIPLNWQILEYVGLRLSYYTEPLSASHIRQVSGIEKVVKFCHLLCLREGERVTQHDKTIPPVFRDDQASPAGLLCRVSVNWLGYTPKEWTGLSLRVVRDNSGFSGRTSKFRAIQPIASRSPRGSPFDPSIEGITSILPESLLYTAFADFPVNERNGFEIQILSGWAYVEHCNVNRAAEYYPSSLVSVMV
ncbi:hypothetical protein B0H14DRAFT_2565361 [Mycena olivaceomarginata]|nr:hypothetical protein B0H14DRAFT_2565361 [Mycena olivaceomarginata]